MKKFLILILMFSMIFTVACVDMGDSTPSIKTGSSYYEGENYEDVAKEFKSAGFTNIKYEIIYDLVLGFLVSDGEVEYVTIDGSKEFKDISEYSKDVEIIIAYHTYESNNPENPNNPNNPEIPSDIKPSQDIYDDTYIGDKYRVNFIVDFDSNLFFDIYDVDFRVDGRKFETLKHGKKSNFEMDLKPGEHYISFTNEDNINVYGQIVLDVSSDMVVNYWIKGHAENVELKEKEIIHNAYCTITFDCNGGNNIAPVKKKKGHYLQNTLGYMTPLGMDDYYFLGWYLGEDKIESEYLVYEDITVTAKWKKKSDFVYDYAFISDLSEYDLYYLFDIDKNRYVHFGTGDTYVEYGSYVGNLESNMKVELFDDKGYYEGEHIYFKMSSAKGIYYDPDNFDWWYSKYEKPWELELKYEQILKDKNSIGSKNFTFELINDNTEYEITGFTGTATEIVIPSEYKGKPVTRIDDYAFECCENLTCIVIPKSVTNFGEGAFLNCNLLSKVNYLGNLDSWAQIKFVDFWANPLYYGKDLYIQNKLVEEVTLLETNIISNYAFAGGSLKKVTIPNTISQIGHYAFYDCDSLIYNTKSGLNYLGNSENKYLYLAGVEDLKIKSAVIDSMCKFIADSAFQECSLLENIEMSENIISIGVVTFDGCKMLDKIVIPQSVLYIGNNAFNECYSLTIYCETVTKPDTWSKYWNYSNCPVVWGYNYENN